MRDLRRERTRRAGVREERLRSTAGVRQASLPLSSWRGRSGRRYVVGIHPLDEAHVIEVTDAVCNVAVWSYADAVWSRCVSRAQTMTGACVRDCFGELVRSDLDVLR